MTNQRTSRWISYALLAGVVILTLAGVLLILAYFSARNSRDISIPVEAPLQAVAIDKVAPDLAVLTLAGEDDERIVRAARDAGELETAYATLASSTLLPDSPRSGLWQLLADDLSSDDRERALIAAGATMDMAALAPQLGDLARADISLQAADSYRGLGADAAARLALTQAEEIGRHSLSLLPAQRRAVLVRVADALQKSGDLEAARLVRERLAEASVGTGIQAPATTTHLAELRGSVVLPAEVAAAIEARQEAAANLAARWLAADPNDRATLASALGDALLAEDQIRSDAYARLGDLSDADRLALLHDQIAWLTVMRRVSQRGYGVSLVPEWETREDAISQQLASTYMELINGYGRQLNLVDPADYEAARVELLRQGLLWSRLGLFPGDAGDELGRQLIEASEQLRQRMGDTGMSTSAAELAGKTFYILRGDEPTVEQASALSGGRGQATTQP